MEEDKIYKWIEKLSRHRDNFLVALTYYTCEKGLTPRNEEKLKNEEKNLIQRFKILKFDIEYLEKHELLREE